MCVLFAKRSDSWIYSRKFCRFQKCNSYKNPFGTFRVISILRWWHHILRRSDFRLKLTNYLHNYSCYVGCKYFHPCIWYISGIRASRGSFWFYFQTYTFILSNFSCNERSIEMLGNSTQNTFSTVVQGFLKLWMYKSDSYEQHLDPLQQKILLISEMQLSLKLD